MAITSIKTGSSFTNLIKYNDFLAGNTAFNPIPPNSYESIATVTVGSGGTGDITFSSIPSTYAHLQIRMIGKSTYTGSGLVNCSINFNSDSNNNNYSSHNLTGNGASASAGGSANYRTRAFYISTTDDGWSANIIDILDYANTNKYKTTRTLQGNDNNGSGNVYFTSVNWRNTNAVTSITLVPEPLFAQYSSIALYGIKDS